MAPTDVKLRKGSQGPDVNRLVAAARRRYASYAFEIDGVTPLREDQYFGLGEERFTETWQARMKRPVTGRLTVEEFEYIVNGKPFPTAGSPSLRTGSWIYTMPGSGANWDVGPSFEVGVWAERTFGFRHQPVSFAQGGYLGFMGGDAKLSYVESNFDMFKSLEYLLDHNPDFQARVAGGNNPCELIFSGYSKSADGLEDALEWLFGDGKKYSNFRHLIKVVIQFGNPSKQKDKDGGSPGWNPPGWGIARKIRPQWLKDKVVSITNPMDFYAVVPDSDDIRPAFYGEIITADAELPYFAHLLNIGVQVALKWLPIFGPLLGGLTQGIGIPIIGGMAGLANNASAMTDLTKMFGMAGDANHDTNVDAKLINMFTVEGLISTMPDLIGLIAALPGLQNHGMYHVPFPELGNRSGIQVGCDLVRMVVEGKI